MNQIFFVVLAGGSGQRLWPLSTKKRPKHLIPFLNKKSLLEQTIERINDSNINQNIWILTNQDQKKTITTHTKHLNVKVIAEPIAGNTAPAILWACNQINNIDKNAIIVILPADHFIPEKEKFNQTINQAISFVQYNNKIVTLGITPTHPATGYGYIQADLSDNQSCFPVVKFHEKPDLEKAKLYIKQKNMFWNAGMFIGRSSTFLHEFETCNKKLFDDIQNFMQNKFDYSELENISIDYAVMEKSQNIALIPANFEWYDIGNLNVYLNLKKRFEKKPESAITIQGHNNLVSTNKKIVVCIGVSDLCIIETKDVILITKSDKAEDVKKALPEIKKVYVDSL